MQRLTLRIAKEGLKHNFRISRPVPGPAGLVPPENGFDDCGA
jgi:hypothetical protein